MTYPRQNSRWNVSIYKDPNTSLKRTVFVSEFFSVAVPMILPSIPAKQMFFHTQRNISKILLHQIKIRLCLPFSGWFGTKRASTLFQINRKMVYTIWFQFDLMRFRKDFPVCTVYTREKCNSVPGWINRTTVNTFRLIGASENSIICNLEIVQIYFVLNLKTFSVHKLWTVKKRHGTSVGWYQKSLTSSTMPDLLFLLCLTVNISFSFFTCLQ